jgi:hypothetical protein
MDKLEIKQGSFIKQTQYFIRGNRFARRTGTFGNLWFFHLSRRTTVIQDLLVRRQFSLVPDNRTNINVEACRLPWFSYDLQIKKKFWCHLLYILTKIKSEKSTFVFKSPENKNHADKNYYQINKQIQRILRVLK